MTTRKAHKARGAGYEVDIRDYFRLRGYDAERLARAGSKDEGDVVVRMAILGRHLLLECKAPGASGRIDLSGWAKEAKVEAENFRNARSLGPESVLPAVIIKARGKSIADSYLVFRLGDIFE